MVYEKKTQKTPKKQKQKKPGQGWEGIPKVNT